MRGKIRPRPMAVSAISPAHRIASCGRCSSDSSEVPRRVTRLKLSTRPPITRYGRSLSDNAGLALTAVAVPPPDSATGSERVPCAPEKKITGSTGRMHGEMPVIRPPRKPISTSVNMSVIRSRKHFGWVDIMPRRRKSPRTLGVSGAFAAGWAQSLGRRAASAPCRSCRPVRWRSRRHRTPVRRHSP